MAIIRNAANRKLVGRVGDTTYYVSLDRQVARQALNSSNYGESARRSEAQQNRRVRWANLVNFYKASTGWMSKAFESKSKNQTDYNRFMSVNINTTRIALTKEMAAVGACVADSFIVSQGSLSSIRVEQESSCWATDIQLGTLSIVDSTTVAKFSQAVIANNSNFLAGDQISFISYQQYLDAQDFPRVLCAAYEVTLDTNNNELLSSYLPKFAASTLKAGFLTTGADISVGGFAYVHSRNASNGRLLVSTQNVVTNNRILVEQYSSEQAFLRAIESYGLDTDSFLDTGSKQVPVVDQPIYITSVYASTLQRQIPAGGDTEDLGSFLNSGPAVITFSGAYPSGSISVVVVTNTSNFFDGEVNTLPLSIEAKDAETISAGYSSSSHLDEYVMRFEVNIGTEKFVVEFAPTDPIE